MQKNLYIAPQAEQIQIKFEENIMSTTTPKSPANMNTDHNADEWGDGWE